MLDLLICLGTTQCQQPGMEKGQEHLEGKNRRAGTLFLKVLKLHKFYMLLQLSLSITQRLKGRSGPGETRGVGQQLDVTEVKILVAGPEYEHE